MKQISSTCILLLVGLTAIIALAAAPVEKLKNEQVVVTQQTLGGGESTSSTDRPRVAIYLDEGSIQSTDSQERTQTRSVKRGDVVFEPAPTARIQNSGSSNLRVVWIEFTGKGGSQTWGTTGLAASYKLLFENTFARAYDVKIPAGSSEPLHSHQARVVVCLSGADLRHEMPGGRTENSSLKTGEIVWRPVSTHIGNNIGTTDLWVICIEPK